MVINNPILSGMHPDPSICRVGKDFYLVNSTLEYFPGIPVYHSTDLVNWEQIGHCLTRESQFKLKKAIPNCIGIYAPTIRYNNGTFYCIVTNVGSEINGGNFFVWTKDPYGEWSDPVYLDFDGIDPSLFFDDDGKVYYTGTDKGIFICEIDIETGARKSDKVYDWNGNGSNNPEGPHLYKIDGMYYLMIAEGGTELNHQVTIARSNNVFGPYEGCPYNPIMTNRGTELPIKAIGHADLVDDCNGNWWAVCLGNRPLMYPFKHNMGRETNLVPVKWVNGWPVMGDNGLVREVIELPYEAGEKTPDTGRYMACSNVTDNFKGSELHPSWNYIYNPVEGLVEITGENVILHGNECDISSVESKAILCRRQEHFDFEATVTMSTDLKDNGEEAGLTIYMNNKHHYEIAVAMINNKKNIIVRRQIGSLKAIEAVIPYSSDTVELKLTGSKEKYGFMYRDGDEWKYAGEGEAQYLTTEVGGCFTGNYLGVYATRTDAVLTSFSYIS